LFISQLYWVYPSSVAGRALMRARRGAVEVST
jgi:hypothetical protein